MEILDPNDMEILDEPEVLTEGDFDVEDEPSIPELIASNITKSVQSTVPAVEGGADALQTIGEAGLDTARGVGQGLTLGATDEIGGALSALIDRPLTYAIDRFQGVPEDLAGVSETSNLLDRYRESQQNIQKELEMSQERSPWLYTGGQIAGGITSGSAISGALGIGKAASGAKSLSEIAKNEGKLKALGELGLRAGKTYKEALPVMLAEGALSSQKGGLTSEEEAKELTKDVAGSALFGIPAVLGLQAVSDYAVPAARETAKSLKNSMTETISENPLLRQMRVAYDYGTQGINPKAQSVTLNTDLGAAKNLTKLDNERTVKLMDEIFEAQGKVGKDVRLSLDNATAQGKMVDVGNDIQAAAKNLSELQINYPEAQTNTRVNGIFNKLIGGQKDVTPSEAKDLIDYMDSYIGKFESSTNKTPLEQSILPNLYQLRKQFSNTLKIAVPEYGRAAQRYSEFSRLVPETILSKNRPVSVTDTFFSETRDRDKKLFDALKALNQGTTKEGSATQPVRESFVNTIQGLKEFEQKEAKRFFAGEIESPAFKRTASEIENEIKKNSDDAVARGSMDALEPNTGVANTFAKAITGTGETGRSISLSSANIAGRVANKISTSTTNNPISKVAKSIYSAPNETVLELSQKLKSVPSLQKYGQSLEEALNSPDSNKRNQVLFTIMQNPNARAFVKEDTENNETTP